MVFIEAVQKLRLITDCLVLKANSPALLEAVNNPATPAWCLTHVFLKEKNMGYDIQEAVIRTGRLGEKHLQKVIKTRGRQALSNMTISSAFEMTSSIETLKRLFFESPPIMMLFSQSRVYSADSVKDKLAAINNPLFVREVAVELLDNFSINMCVKDSDGNYSGLLDFQTESFVSLLTHPDLTQAERDTYLNCLASTVKQSTFSNNTTWATLIMNASLNPRIVMYICRNKSIWGDIIGTPKHEEDKKLFVKFHKQYLKESGIEVEGLLNEYIVKLVEIMVDEERNAVKAEVCDFAKKFLVGKVGEGNPYPSTDPCESVKLKIMSSNKYRADRTDPLKGYTQAFVQAEKHQC